MLATTSTNTVTGSALRVLIDHDLHHSGNPPVVSRSEAQNPPHTDVLQNNNPDWWRTDHRQIPDYRPINRNLDRSLRPDGVNTVERLFIFTMLRGVQLNANLSYVWRNTGGCLNQRLFRYEIGGEK